MMSSRLLDQFEVGSATLGQDFGAGSRPIKKRAESRPVSVERRVHTAKTVSVNGKIQSIGDLRYSLHMHHPRHNGQFFHEQRGPFIDPALYAVQTGTKVQTSVASQVVT
jgi:hypothetical protein